MTEALPFGLSHVDDALADRLRTGLDDVEVALRTAVTSEYPFVTEASSHLVSAGGKRFRPLLALVASQYGDPEASGNVPGAVVAELTHLATLYHDDVMDEAPLRRGAPSANARWDNTVAILTGDFLFARAADIAADLGTDIVRLQARTFERLCTGQIRETVGPAEGEDPVVHHLEVLAGKAGTDLREGIRTLPVLLALRGTDPEGARLRELLAEPLVDDDLHAEALGLLRSSPAMVEARAELVSWAESARAELAALPAGPATDALSMMCDVVVDRSA